MSCMGAMHWESIDFLPVVELFKSLLPGTGSAVFEFIRGLYDDQNDGKASPPPLRYRGIPTYPSEAAFRLFNSFFVPQAPPGKDALSLFMDPTKSHQVEWLPSPTPPRRYFDHLSRFLPDHAGWQASKGDAGKRLRRLALHAPERPQLSPLRSNRKDHQRTGRHERSRAGNHCRDPLAARMSRRADPISFSIDESHRLAITVYQGRPADLAHIKPMERCCFTPRTIQQSMSWPPNRLWLTILKILPSKIERSAAFWHGLNMCSSRTGMRSLPPASRSIARATIRSACKFRRLRKNKHNSSGVSAAQLQRWDWLKRIRLISIARWQEDPRSANAFDLAYYWIPFALGAIVFSCSPPWRTCDGRLVQEATRL